MLSDRCVEQLARRFGKRGSRQADFMLVENPAVGVSRAGLIYTT
jgi:hypothetical protein